MGHGETCLPAAILRSFLLGSGVPSPQLSLSSRCLHCAKGFWSLSKGVGWAEPAKTLVFKDSLLCGWSPFFMLNPAQ